MDKLFNTTLNPQYALSRICSSKNLRTFGQVFDFVKRLPYGRTTDRSDFRLVLTEEKGTCSTKHALLKAIALENAIEDLELYVGIFNMNAIQIPDIKPILDANGLDYIPEAHCYLKYQNEIIDVTFPDLQEMPRFITTLRNEERIQPKQIGSYKLAYHQKYLKTWIKDEPINLSFNAVWDIREACIRHISA